MKDARGVGLGIERERGDLKDLSRLKLIEILFVTFAAFYVSSFT